MRTVRCVSPHGGGHDGFLPSGEWAPPGWDGPLILPPNPGGYIDNAVLGRVAVGAELDAPDDFTPDGYHFIDVPPAGGTSKDGDG
jgi:hypothetical protein